jgi:hypothetical protein
MTQDHPTLREQIEAVEWAARHLDGAWPQPIEDIRRCLEEAAETLKTWEFAQAVIGG